MKNLKKIGDCFGKAKSPESITHVHIFDNYGKYYFKKVNNNFKGTLQQFDIGGQHFKNVKNLKSLLRNNINLKRSRYYTRYILFRTVSSKSLMCNQDCVLDQDLECLVDEEKLRYYVGYTILFRLCESL